jgi:hypothetical protein
MLREMEKNRGERGQFHGLSSPVTARETPPTLPDLGIARNESSKWQKLAEIPEETFEQKIVELKQNPERVTTTSIIRESGPAKEQAKKPRPPEDKLEALHDKQVGRHPDGEFSREEVEADVDPEEIELSQRMAEKDAERVNLLLSSDDALAAFAARNKELDDLNAKLELRINRLIDEKGDAIRFAKGKDRIIKKLEKENAALKAELSRLQSNEPETIEF